MTIEQIIQLTQAGFTAEQITALAPLINNPVAQQNVVQQNVVQQSVEQPAQQNVEQHAKQNVEQPAQQNVEQPAQKNDNSVTAEILKQLSALTSAIHNGNVNNMNNNPAAMTAEDVAASIINPTPRK